MGFHPTTPRGNVFASQVWKSDIRKIESYGAGATIQAGVRFDDQCKNGHNTFSVTAEVRGPKQGMSAGGCLHREVSEIFPELAHLVKWHLVRSDGPLHYIANTTYHAGDRDCNGLQAVERRQIRNGRTGQLCWELVGVVDGVEVPLRDIPRRVDADDCPTTPEVRYAPWCRVGEGKVRGLDAARSVAVWPDATDEQLCLPKDELTKLLEARLPQLMKDFRADVEAFGFQWSPT